MVILFGRRGGSIKHPRYQYSFNTPDVHFCIQCSAPLIKKHILSYEIFNFKCTCILFQVAEQLTQNGNIETVVQIRTTCDNFHTSGMLCTLLM
jgi:hypothetical protein